MQYVQEFYQTVRDKCFKVCVTSPGSSLSSSEQKCLGRCMDRYQDVRLCLSFFGGLVRFGESSRRRRHCRSSSMRPLNPRTSRPFNPPPHTKN